MLDEWLRDFVVHALQVAIGAGAGFLVGHLRRRPAAALLYLQIDNLSASIDRGPARFP